MDLLEEAEELPLESLTSRAAVADAALRRFDPSAKPADLVADDLIWRFLEVDLLDQTSPRAR